MNTPPAPGFEDPRRFLKLHSLRPKDSFGQCFLVAEPIARAIVEALAPSSSETIIEIGTGTGTLARMCAALGAPVIAIERDRDLVRALEASGLPPEITLLEADAGAYDYAARCAESPCSIAGNLPYQITGRLLRAILAPPIRWRTAVVMVQREVARRLLATPNDDDWGVLSVFTQAACHVRKVVEASPGCFHPPPRVHSTVVALTPRETPLAAETPALQRVVHATFSARRKTLRNGLSSLLERSLAERACADANIDPGLRPETLSIAQLGALAEACAALAPHINKPKRGE